MSNFGPPSPREDDEQPGQADTGEKNNMQDPVADKNAASAQKPAKQNKRKLQISQLIDSHPKVMEEFVQLIKKVTLEGLKANIQGKVYKLLAKLKKNNKQINESVINRDDFMQLLVGINGKGLSEECQSLIQPLVQVNPNHGHIYQAKMVCFLLDEVNAKNEMMSFADVQQT